MSLRSKFAKKINETSAKFVTIISRQKEGKTTAFSLLKEAILLDTQEGVKADMMKILNPDGTITSNQIYKVDIVDMASLLEFIEEMKAAPSEERFKIGIIDVLTDFVKPIMDMTLTNFMKYVADDERAVIEERLEKARVKATENYAYLLKDIEELKEKLKAAKGDEKAELKQQGQALIQKYNQSVAASIVNDKVVIVESYPYGKIEKSLNSAFQELKTLLGSVFDKVIFSCHAVVKSDKGATSFSVKEFDMNKYLKPTVIAQSDAVGFGYRVGNNYILDFKSTSAASNAYGTRYPHLREKKVLLTELVDPDKSIFKHNWHIIFPDIYGEVVDDSFVERNAHCYTELAMNLADPSVAGADMG